MRLEYRVRGLERSLGDGGNCPHGPRVVWGPEEGQRPSLADACPECGLPKVVVRVLRSDRAKGGKP
jgi:hypothetical protein